MNKKSNVRERVVITIIMIMLAIIVIAATMVILSEVSRDSSMRKKDFSFNVGDDRVLNRINGIAYGPSGVESFYNRSVEANIIRLKKLGYDYDYWIRNDGVKMYGNYVMCSDLSGKLPLGSTVVTSLGTAIVCDNDYDNDYYSSIGIDLDIAVNWK